MSQTSPAVGSQYQVYEGSSLQSLVFDLTFSPASGATYSVGGSGTSGLWGVNVFFSSDSSGTSNIRGLQTLQSLTAGQQSTIWDPPSSTTISGIQASSLNVGSGALCSDLQYFCATINKGTSPSPDFEIVGDPTSSSLLGCTSVTCRG